MRVCIHQIYDKLGKMYIQDTIDVSTTINEKVRWNYLT